MDSANNHLTPSHTIMNESINAVTVTVSGRVGSGKSALCGEIEILCKALGLQVEWKGGQEEKNLTHADWTDALEMYKPSVVIVEQIERATPIEQPSDAAIAACALMIKGICMTRPQETWTADIEKRIRFMLNSTPSEQPDHEAVLSEDAYVAQRMTETLAEVYATIIGDDDRAEDQAMNAIERVKKAAQVLRLEVDLYRAQRDAATPIEQAVGVPSIAAQKGVLLTGELVELGVDESGAGDMKINIGARDVSISGLSSAETRMLAPFLFQRITLTAAPTDCSANHADCPNNEGYGCGCTPSNGDQES